MSYVQIIYDRIDFETHLENEVDVIYTFVTYKTVLLKCLWWRILFIGSFGYN